MEATVTEKKAQKRMTSKKIGLVLLIILLASIFLYMIALAIIPPLIMHDQIHRHCDVEVESPEDYGVTASPLTLKTEDGLSLAAWEVAADTPKGVVIIISGIHNPTATAFFGYARMLRDNGYSSVLVELRSHGGSEGDKIFLGMMEYLDVKAGVQYIKAKQAYKDLPVIVWGTSMGGATAINAIGEIPELDGVISCSAYSDWVNVFYDNMSLSGAPAWMAAMDKPFVWCYLGFEYGFDKIKINPMEEITKLNGRPALLMHSTKDSQVPYASFERLITKVPASVETFIREGDEHFICYEKHFKNPEQDKEFSSAVLGFLKKHFG